MCLKLDPAVALEKVKCPVLALNGEKDLQVPADVNLDAIQTVKPVENSKLIIRLKDHNHKLDIDMSRVKSPEFKKWMDR